MNDFFLSNIDVVFTVILSLLYLINIFFTKDLLIRFLIFFGSMFICVINYAFIFYRQENFLMFLLLNCIFIVIVLGLLLYSKIHSSILQLNITVFSHLKSNIILILLFLIIFTGFSYVFIYNIFYQANNTNKAEIIINKKEFIRKNNNIDIKNQIQNLKTGNIDYYYLKQIKKFETSNFILKYNSIIILYIIYVIIMYYFSKFYVKEKK